MKDVPDLVHGKFSDVFVFSGTKSVSDDWSFVDRRIVYHVDDRTDNVVTIMLTIALAPKVQHLLMEKGGLEMMTSPSGSVSKKLPEVDTTEKSRLLRKVTDRPSP
eukprot:TRINITY_DN2932_c0_g1_i5.p4 TRINITY_DN2932_c0_g1~~TRINITY_DN2932_c0_g1_i5.p4  ORF type:complete len:105 (+),score=1.12 TRINITY_DN2932_c0_g1_i5:1999-2313(+)